MTRKEIQRSQRVGLPAGWRQLPLKRVANTFSGAGFPIDQQGVASEEIPFLKVLSLSGADVAGWIHGSDDTVSRSTAANLRAPLLDPGTVVIAKIGAALLLGRIRQLAQISTIDNNMLGIVATGAHARFLYFALQTVDFKALVNPGAVPSLSDRNLRMWPIRVPPIEEQQQIAVYLDRETSQIDALISKQEQLVETLTERRQAVILQGITRGLDKNAPMRDSGIEWVGHVPKHWQVGNIRRFASMRTGHTPSRSHQEYWTECEIPWFTLADVWQLRKGQRYLGETNGTISQLGLANSAAELLPPGTVVLSRTASVGFTGIMPVSMATSQDYWNWVCKPDLDPTFLWFQFYAMRPHFASLVHGSTHKTIYQTDAAALKITAPPLAEQRDIVVFLDRETEKIDALSANARGMIDILKERRQALISAAVTGKIDVRGL